MWPRYSTPMRCGLWPLCHQLSFSNELFFSAFYSQLDSLCFIGPQQQCFPYTHSKHVSRQALYAAAGELRLNLRQVLLRTIGLIV